MASSASNFNTVALFKPISHHPGDQEDQDTSCLDPSEAFRVIQSGAGPAQATSSRRQYTRVPTAREESPSPAADMFASSVLYERQPVEKRNPSQRDEVEVKESGDEHVRTRHKATPHAVDPSPFPWRFNSPFTPSPVSHTPSPAQSSSSRSSRNTPFSPLPFIPEFSAKMEE